MANKAVVTKTLLKVLRGEPVSPPPVWLMRQAGRYLPEYRATRATAGGFLDLCYSPELAEEVTLQPIRRFGFDAAILFADILLVPQAMGLKLWFAEGEGPRLAWEEGRIDLSRLRPVDQIDETLAPVYETVGRLSASLPAQTTLIGFAGAPWTVATYMIAGRGTPDQRPARELMYGRPDLFGQLIDRLTDATIHYLSAQIAAGAEVVKLFDTWAGILPPAEFDRYVTAPAAQIARSIRERHPNVPFIGFPRGAGVRYRQYADIVAPDGLALDAEVPLDWARKAMPRTALQGNLDPLLMVLGGDALPVQTRRIVDELTGHPHVFNLGHGITPDADPKNIEILLNTIRK